MIHDLKCWTEYFQAVLDGTKMFDVRLADRNFLAGDQLDLREFIPCESCCGTGQTSVYHNYELAGTEACGTCAGKKGTYTGRHLCVNVLYVGCNIPGVQRGYCVMSIKALPAPSE